jgi:CotH kinase protein
MNRPSGKWRITKERKITMTKMSFLIAVLGLSLLPVTAFAAAETGAIAVLDFRLEKGIDYLDSPNRNDGTFNKVNGTLSGTGISRVDIDLKVHGAGSALYPKKAYALDFKKKYFQPMTTPAEVNKLPDKFLGMPRGREWILHSCWADPTCLRNVIGYWQAAKLFPWAPRTEFAEVYINNEYRGLYVVVEKISNEGTQLEKKPLEDAISRQRVNSPPPSARDRTGTYVLKQDQGDDDPDWTTYSPCTSPGVPPGCQKDGLETPWWLVSPDPTTLCHTTQEAQAAEQSGLCITATERSYIQSLTELVDLRPWTYIDQDSLANYIIMQEWSGNVDGYYRSVYFTKYPSAVDVALHMGPIWDLDVAFGGAYVCTDDASSIPERGLHQWVIHPPEGDGLHGQGAGGRDPTFKSLYTMWADLKSNWMELPPQQQHLASPLFRPLIQQRWATLLNSGIVEYDSSDQSGVSRLITLYAARITKAYARDYDKWGTMRVDQKPDELHPFVNGLLPFLCYQPPHLPTEDAAGRLKAAVKDLKDWIGGRVEWMKTAFKDRNFIVGP